jgi:hypothetical protein
MYLGPLSKVYEYTIKHESNGRITQTVVQGVRHELGAAWLVVTGSDDTQLAIPRERVTWFHVAPYVPPPPKPVEDQLPRLRLPAEHVTWSMETSSLTRQATYSVRHHPTGIVIHGGNRAEAARELHRELFKLGYDADGNPPLHFDPTGWYTSLTNQLERATKLNDVTKILSDCHIAFAQGEITRLQHDHVAAQADSRCRELSVSPRDDPDYTSPDEDPPSTGQRLRNLITRGGIDA